MRAGSWVVTNISLWWGMLVMRKTVHVCVSEEGWWEHGREHMGNLFIFLSVLL